jgi:hypothetical protein
MSKIVLLHWPKVGQSYKTVFHIIYTKFVDFLVILTEVMPIVACIMPLLVYFHKILTVVTPIVKKVL